jgi:uncharacterized protein YneF (UPF0154 family)
MIYVILQIVLGIMLIFAIRGVIVSMKEYEQALKENTKEK